MRDPSGKKSSPLDNLRPDGWQFDDDLLRLLWVLESTIDMLPKLNKNLANIVDSEVWMAAELPTATAADRKPLAEIEDEESLEAAAQMSLHDEDLDQNN
jgi:hypothetical protein